MIVLPLLAPSLTQLLKCCGEQLKSQGIADIANFHHVLKTKNLDSKSGQLRLHPIIKRMLGAEVLEKMGAKPLSQVKVTSVGAKDATAKTSPVQTPKVKTTVKPAAKKKNPKVKPRIIN